MRSLQTLSSSKLRASAPVLQELDKSRSEDRIDCASLANSYIEGYSFSNLFI